MGQYTKSGIGKAEKRMGNGRERYRENDRGEVERDLERIGVFLLASELSLMLKLHFLIKSDFSLSLSLFLSSTETR